MLRSMYAGISGLKGFQTKLDVIGNNIANVNTTGYKKGRVTFQDMMSQSVSGASGPTNIRGGINPSQVGTGVQLGSIDNVHTQGNRQTTGRPLDLQLEGDGMFVFATGENIDGATTEEMDISYSRAGNLYLDNEGYIVNANGQYLLGQNGTDADGNPIDGTSRIKIPDTAESFSIQSNGIVNYIQDGETQEAGQILVAKFSNPGGLNKTGSNMFQNSVNAGRMEDDEGNFLFEPESDGTASVVSGALEMSNVDLSEEFTEMITAQRGFQANTRIITTSDEILQELVNLKR
ncbi:flagellar basal body rod protein FlgG [Gracilibacillus caseinilyticus]|uniref:Flagellar hook protein FlgE n=1 Tax=Gracilibacillus caseinilyticus TaxID=2932256 RepID=A0ABY4ETX6_9BACI|nr:flagellar basal body rod protein FlgG [Gracilibacillus caseinilyticus]UOQ47871.1 flagellar basal body rod protein FlgG [Gracilibacillus caseinilyticus]